MKKWSLRLIVQIIAGIAGLYLAGRFISGVSINLDWQTLVLAGCVIGFLNAFIRPILMIITIPLRILTFGFFSVIINMLMIWAATIVYPAIVIPWFWPLFWVSVLVGLSATLISFVLS
jgi:putative membrane protein